MNNFVDIEFFIAQRLRLMPSSLHPILVQLFCLLLVKSSRFFLLYGAKGQRKKI